MWRILEKWFNLEPQSCLTCEVLRTQLDESNRERRDLLARLLDQGKVEPLSTPPDTDEMKPMKGQFVPWRMRQQMLQDEDRKQAQLLRDKQKEIESLEKELGLTEEMK